MNWNDTETESRLRQDLRLRQELAEVIRKYKGSKPNSYGN